MISPLSSINGRTVSLRLVEEADAALIVRLRNDKRLSAYLSHTSNDVEQQRRWIADYKQRERQGEELYYIIAGMSRGAVRLYDFAGGKFFWGSLVMEHDNVFTVIEVITLVYQIGFECLGFVQARFNVRQNNHRVLALHRRLGARYIGDQGEDSCFEFFPQDYRRLQAQFGFSAELPAAKDPPQQTGKGLK